MLKELVVIVAFVAALTGIVGSLAVLERISAGQVRTSESVLEILNEVG
nr:hypothetical protein [Treponema sp.]MBP3282502.1 hypothetical protein [Treponema sp.]